MNAGLKAAAAAALALSLTAGPAAAAPGDLDLTFGGDGVAQSTGGTLRALIVGSDGRITGAGSVRSADEDVDVALARWGADGGLDGSFGAGGVFVSPRPTGGANPSVSEARALAATPAGLVTGGRTHPPGNGTGLLTAHGPNGALDPTFEGAGVRVSPEFAGGAVNDVVVLADGRFIAGGYRYGLGRANWVVERFAANGTRDETYSNDGKQGVAWAAGGPQDILTALLPDGTDGAVIAAGSSDRATPAAGPRAFTVGRFRADGTLDPAFGATDGRTRIEFGSGSATANDIARTPDGGLIMTGDIDQTTWALAKVNSEGDLVTGFGDGGRATARPGSGSRRVIRSVAVDVAGRIVVAGTIDDAFAVARFLPNGRLDPAFGNGGVRLVGTGEAWDVEVQPDGKIVAGGTTPGGMTVVRLLGAASGSSNSGGGDGTGTDTGTIGGPGGGSGNPGGSPQGGGKTKARVSVRLLSRRVTKRGVLVRVRWPKGTRGTARVRLHTLGGTRLGQRTVAARKGTGKTFRVPLNRRAKRMMAGGRRLKIRVSVRVTGMPAPPAAGSAR